ncbi:MAG: 16S rRNA (cytidine(1402)-2'-O)-methyltransferase [Lactobacillales bacterium]|jgi:16S rRNA (cytidine1402-2'-O)-methyltransferase|nr:16S rRNA (cytidine(1402)-2'-O)-methyltransferase [Lactobacillales bacterium]
MRIQKSFKGASPFGVLYLVPTPIGNLEDITYRAVRLLSEVDFVASEDTRNTGKLLNHFEIKKQQIILHEHNFKEKVPEIVSLLKEGKNIAQVSDAGMPSISDPGHELVLACIEEEIRVVSIPGPTAGLTALIASGLDAKEFTFYGFLPRKKGQLLAWFEEHLSDSETQIFYESPHRVKTLFEAATEVYGAERRGVLCRELTKIYEEYTRGTLAELADYLAENEIKGECCVLIEGAQEQTVDLDLNDDEITAAVEKYIQSGMKPNAAIKEVAKQLGKSKQEVYAVFHGLDLPSV